MATKDRVFISGKEIDLHPDSPIALTFQINDLAEAKNQQGNTSNQFQVPGTEKNRKIFGFPDDINYNDPGLTIQLPYSKFTAKYILDDVEILPNAICELNDPAWDNGNISITILSGNVDFFDQIGGQLADMGDSTSQWSGYGSKLVFKPYDHIWNLQNVATSQKNTADSGNNGIGGWIYPMVDYGLFTEDFTQRYDVHFMRPGFFIKTAVDLMLKFTGYKGRGTLLKNPLYPKLIAQFSNGSWQHGLDYQNQPDDRGMIVIQNTARQINHPLPFNPDGIFYYDTIQSDPQAQLEDGLMFRSKFINNVKAIVTFPHVLIYGHVNSSSDPSTLTAYMWYRDPNYPSTPDTILTQIDFTFVGGEYDPVTNPTGWVRLNGSSGSNIDGKQDLYNYVMSAETQLPAGGGIYSTFTWSGRTPSYAYIYPGSSFEVQSENQDVAFGQMIQCEKILPDIAAKDLLKDTLQRFGIICQTDDYSATINFASLADIVNNIPFAKDWSSKLVNQSRQVSLTLGNYAQVNRLTYQVDPNSGLKRIPDKFAWSQININDKRLSPVPNDMIVSVFGASLNRPFYGGSTAYIQMVDPGDENKAFGVAVAPRILVDQKYDIRNIGKSVTFTDDPNSNPADTSHNVVINDIISIPYFWKAGIAQTDSLLWEDLRKLYYATLERILKNCKKVVEYFILSPRDIAELDLLIPIYLQQYSSYFYINKIDSWIENVPVKVELVKLGS